MSDRKLFHLLLDESGLFCETSTNPGDQALARSKRPFPSQLAGIVVPDGEETGSRIESLVNMARRQVGMEATDEFHGTDLVRDPAYNDLVVEVARQIQKPGWQAVRMVNKEGVSYGDRRQNYSNIVTELAVRILEKLGRAEDGPLELKLWPAIVITSSDPDIPLWKRTILPDEYILRIQEQMALLAVRMGWAEQSARWRLTFGGTPSGKKDQRFWICDLLSNASHDDYSARNRDARQALNAAFGDCDFTLSIPEIPNRVTDLRQQGFQGLALRELAEHAIRNNDEDQHAATLDKIRRDLLDDLVRAGAPARDNHLATLAAWVDQLIDHARDLIRGPAAARWLVEQVARPLAHMLDDQAASISWFQYQMHRAILSASNHRGDLTAAREAMHAMVPLTPHLAERWEHGDVLLRGLVVEAVHRTDCYEHTEARDRSRLVAGFYGSLADLCHDALGDVFPETVRSQVLGEALGTELQAEMYAGGLDDAARLESLRSLSDRALDQFSREEDRNRQLQYRCQLEMLAGQFEEARRYLAQAVGVEEPAYGALWSGAQGDGPARPWFLLHYLRLASRALLHGSAGERKEAQGVIARARLECLPEIVTPPPQEYPAHGIRRYAAVAAAATGDVNGALSILGQLRALYPEDNPTRQPLLATIRIATHLEVAACLWSKSEAKARELIDSADRGRPGALTLLERLLRQTGDDLPGFAHVFGPWMEDLPGLLKSGGDATAVRSALLAMGAQVGY
ncbi:MAG: hypothetical protein V2A76_13750 [Planctomycetota bacterium]